MSSSEIAPNVPILELNPDLKERIIDTLTELCNERGFQPNFIVLFGSTLHTQNPKDIDVLVITKSEDVEYREREIRLDGVPQPLDVKLVGLNYIEIKLNQFADQVSSDGANMSLPVEEQWLVLGLCTGSLMKGTSEELSGLIEMAKKIYARLGQSEKAQLDEGKED